MCVCVPFVRVVSQGELALHILVVDARMHTERELPELGLVSSCAAVYL